MLTFGAPRAHVHELVLVCVATDFATFRQTDFESHADYSRVYYALPVAKNIDDIIIQINSKII